MVNSKFIVGDIVKVFNRGSFYTTYSKMFQKMGFIKIDTNYYPDNVETLEFKVFAVEPHTISKNRIVVGIESENGLQLLINQDGLKLIAHGKNFKKIKYMSYKELKVSKTKKIEVNGVNREVTLVVASDDKGYLYAGYSVLSPEDKRIEGLSEKIALGRAKNEKTDLLNESRSMRLGQGMDKKFILYAVMENLFFKIEKGIIKIKGVR